MKKTNVSYFGLNKPVIQKINAIFSHYSEIEKAIIYGSRAKGNHRPGSDIDITLLGHITLDQLNRIASELDDLFLPYLIDLSIYNNIDNIELIEHINRVGKILYQNRK